MKRLLPFVMLLAACSDSPEQSPELQWRVVDTDFSKGRLGHEQTVTFTDLEKLHGHWCDGLVVGAIGLGEALKELYPTAPIDRTDLRVISRSSPCLTDVAIMLTGGRAQFGTFQVSDTIPGLYIVQRISDGRTYIVKLRPGCEARPHRQLGPLRRGPHPFTLRARFVASHRSKLRCGPARPGSKEQPSM